MRNLVGRNGHERDVLLMGFKLLRFGEFRIFFIMLIEIFPVYSFAQAGRNSQPEVMEVAVIIGVQLIPKVLLVESDYLLHLGVGYRFLSCIDGRSLE